MKLAKVIGTVVSTQKVESIANVKLLMVQPLDHELEPDGVPIVAADSVQAGYGDLVYLTLGKEGALALDNPQSPVEAAITGIVDQVNDEKKAIPNKEKIFREEA